MQVRARAWGAGAGAGVAEGKARACGSRGWGKAGVGRGTAHRLATSSCDSSLQVTRHWRRSSLATRPGLPCRREGRGLVVWWSGDLVVEW